MNHVISPVHTHRHRFWMVPDSPLGKWAAVLFAGAGLTVVVAPLIAEAARQIAPEPGSDTPWFFVLWGAMLMALTLALITGVLSLVAFVRDHAVLLLIPAVLGIAGTAVLIRSAGLLV